MRAIVAWCMLLVAGFGLRAEVAPVQTVTARWPYPGDLSGVTFYIKDSVGIVTNVIAVVSNATTVTLSNLVAGPHNLFVTASNFWGETEPSKPFITPSKPVTPGQLQPISTTFRVTPPVSFEKTEDLISWDERFRLFKPDSNGVQVVMQTIRPTETFEFYRIRSEPRLGLPR